MSLGSHWACVTVALPSPHQLYSDPHTVVKDELTGLFRFERTLDKGADVVDVDQTLVIPIHVLHRLPLWPVSYDSSAMVLPTAFSVRSTGNDDISALHLGIGVRYLVRRRTSVRCAQVLDEKMTLYPLRDLLHLALRQLLCICRDASHHWHLALYAFHRTIEAWADQTAQRIRAI